MSGHPIKKALYAALSGNATLVALCGHVNAISAQWPDADVRCEPIGLGADYANLPAAWPPRARVTFVLIAPQKNIHLPSRDDLFQVDVWSLNPELREEIVQQLEALDQSPLTVLSGRVTEVLVQRGPDLYEPDTKIHHTPVNVRVLWTP
jgi:hypothetical protein